MAVALRQHHKLPVFYATAAFGHTGETSILRAVNTTAKVGFWSGLASIFAPRTAKSFEEFDENGGVISSGEAFGNAFWDGVEFIDLSGGVATGTAEDIVGAAMNSREAYRLMEDHRTRINPNAFDPASNVYQGFEGLNKKRDMRSSMNQVWLDD